MEATLSRSESLKKGCRGPPKCGVSLPCPEYRAGQGASLADVVLGAYSGQRQYVEETVAAEVTYMHTIDSAVVHRSL
ncbi:hypothetical protein AB0O76_17820 [Streptomyces sp. NPDC086554]|uniref:hypothetical protein n=1 Tax=Streptomyces sp. NPDC086554 TaxID=3154864 RepID=UPI003443AABC